MAISNNIETSGQYACGPFFTPHIGIWSGMKKVYNLAAGWQYSKASRPFSCSQPQIYFLCNQIFLSPETVLGPIAWQGSVTASCTLFLASLTAGHTTRPLVVAEYLRRGARPQDCFEVQPAGARPGPQKHQQTMGRERHLNRDETFSFVNPWIRYFLFFFSFLFWVSRVALAKDEC